MSGKAKILLVGHTGLEKKDAAHRLQELLPTLRPDWVNRVKVVFLERCIERAGGSDTRLLAEATNYRDQRTQWFAGWRQAQMEFNESGALCQILVMHLSFAARSIRSCPVDFDAVAEWRPNFIITFIDDVYSVKRRIELKRFSFTLAQLYAWRSTEQMLADKLGVLAGIRQQPANDRLAHAHCESLTVAAKTPLLSVARLLAHPESPRAYASYPISEPRADEGLRGEINGFRERLHRTLPTFDPLTIEELPLLNWYRPGKGPVNFDPRRGPPWQKDVVRLKRWDCRLGQGDLAPLVWEPETCPDAAGKTANFFPVVIPEAEFEQLLVPGQGLNYTLVHEQLDVRDLRYVAQADFLVCWRPFLAGRVSGGVNREIVQANQMGRDVIAFVGKDKRPAGVLQGKITREFANEEEFWGFLTQEAAKSKDLPRAAFY